MYKKLLSSLLVIALLNLVGCYSAREVTLNDILANDEMSEITITTKDSLKLLFEKPDFAFMNDTLKGKASVISSYSQESEKFDWNIPISDIVKFEIAEFDGVKTLIFTGATILVLIGIFLFILAASGGIMSGFEMKL